MTRRRATIGLCTLCALAFSAFAAQSASAESKGTTLFTCKKKAVDGGAGFSKPHCKSADAVASGANFAHVAIPADTTTQIATAGNTPTEGEAPEVQFLQTTAAGVQQELQVNVTEKDSESSGWTINRIDPSTGEHYAEGEISLTLTEVRMTKPAAVTGCTVYGKEGELTKESITVGPMKATTKGQGDSIKFQPAEGTLFTRFFIIGCSKPEFNGEYKVDGSLVAEIEGATLRCKAATITSQNTLKMRGQKASIQGSMTIAAYDEAEGQKPDEAVALSATTVATP